MSDFPKGARVRFRLLSAAAAAASALLLISGCTVTDETNPIAKKDIPRPTVEVTADVPGKKLALKVTDGTFENVQLIDDDAEGSLVDLGEFKAPSDEASEEPTDGTTDAAEGSDSSDEASEDTVRSADPSTGPSASTSEEASDDQQTAWESSYLLAGDSTYTWTATALDAEGKEHKLTGTVDTDKLERTEISARTLIGDNQKVGVGAPIIVNFGSTVPEKFRATVESRLGLSFTDADGSPRDIEGSWAWLPDVDGISRIHYRPREYWPEHTDVDLQMNLKDVPMSKRQKGEKDVELKFTVDRNQVVEGNTKTHRMVVKRNGETKWDFPASFGRAGSRTETHNGTHIVMSKHEYYVMRSQQWDYETPTRHAVRIHNNGEFIHGAPWSVGSQGSANVSHGCVNLAPGSAQKYFNSALYGDPVEIKGSSVSLSPASGDVADWTYEWDEWTDLSAIPADQREAAEEAMKDNAASASPSADATDSPTESTSAPSKSATEESTD